nr:hypothetical protein [Luteimonas panaciterrae]
MIPVAQRLDSLPQDIGIPLFIMLSILILIVLPAIQLNRQLQFVAIEIQDIGAQRFLPAEFLLVQAAIAQEGPDDPFRIRGFLPEPPHERESFLVEGQLFPGTCTGRRFSRPHPAFGHLLPAGEGRSDCRPPCPFVHLGRRVEPVQWRCECQRGTAAMLAHDDVGLRPAKHITSADDIDAPAFERRVIDTTRGLQRRAGIREIDVAAGQPA